MSLIDEVIGALEDEGRDSGSTRPEGYYPMAGYIIADLAGRGIELELAYQWHRAEKATGKIRNVAWSISLTSGYPFGYKTEALGFQGETVVMVGRSTPAAALSALADAMEARE